MRKAVVLLCVSGLFASTAPQNSEPAILFLGDSLTAGYGLDPEQAFPAIIQERIRARGWNFRVLNGGVSGDTSAGGLRRIGWMLRHPIDVLVLELGANDGLRGLPLDQLEKNLQGIIDVARKKNPDLQVVVAGMMVPPNLGVSYQQAFRQVFIRVAEANRAVLIPFLLEGVAGKKELNQDDGIHPTAEGHQIIAETLWKYLEPLLERLAQKTDRPSPSPTSRP